MPSDKSLKLIMNLLHHSGAARMASRWLRGRGAIFMLHRVTPLAPGSFAPNSHLTVTPEFLERSIARLKARGFEFVSMDEAARRISARESKGENSAPFAAFTLDDGYQDNHDYAVPLFRRFNVPFTIYVAPGLVDGSATLWWEDLEKLVAARDNIFIDLPSGRMEVDLRDLKQKEQGHADLLRYLTTGMDERRIQPFVRELCWMYGVDTTLPPERQVMDWQAIARLAADPLCTIGAHTINHYALARLPVDLALEEMSESARLIELETGVWPQHFAYPYGYPSAAGRREFTMARQLGFKTAVTTRHGVCYHEHADQLTALPRISLNGRFQKTKYVATMASGATTRLANKGGKLNVN